MKALVYIRPNPPHMMKRRYETVRHRNRNVIELFFYWIKHYRRVATQYEKKAASFAEFVWLAALTQCLV